MPPKKNSAVTSKASTNTPCVEHQILLSGEVLLTNMCSVVHEAVLLLKKSSSLLSLSMTELKRCKLSIQLPHLS